MLGMALSAALAAAVSAQSAAQATPDQEKSGAKRAMSWLDSDRDRMFEIRERVGKLNRGESGGEPQSGGSVRAGRRRLHPDRCNDVERFVVHGHWNGGLDSRDPAASSSMSGGTTYRLTGSASDFSTLVGKKLEVKGTLRRARAKRLALTRQANRAPRVRQNQHPPGAAVSRDLGPRSPPAPVHRKGGSGDGGLAASASPLRSFFWIDHVL